MFNEYGPEKSKALRILTRLGISLGAGIAFTFVVPSVMNTLWPYFQDTHFQPHPLAILVAKILNLPAVIFCRLSTLPPGLPKSDDSFYCWSVGFFFNIPYYALVIFLFWSLILKLLRSKSVVQLESQG